MCLLSWKISQINIFQPYQNKRLGEKKATQAECSEHGQLYLTREKLRRNQKPPSSATARRIITLRKLLNLTRRLRFFNNLITTGYFLGHNMSERYTTSWLHLGSHANKYKIVRAAISFTCHLRPVHVERQQMLTQNSKFNNRKGKSHA